MNKRIKHIKKFSFEKIYYSLLIVCLLLFVFLPNGYVESLTMVDSGIDYSDGLENVNRNGYLCTGVGYCTMDALYKNPGRGFFPWAAGFRLYIDDSKNKAANPSSANNSLIYLAVDIHDFSGAYHLDEEGNRGEDYELTESALNALDKTLQNIRNNNNQVILRFVYDAYSDGVQANEGYIYYEVTTKKQFVEARQEMILRHIEQLGPVLNKNADVIYTIQEGIYGAYGELHTSAMCTNENIKEALTKLLEVTRESGIRISVRTPSRYAHYLGINIADIESYPSSIGEDAYRIAIFNDGYLGNSTDWGTYQNRTKEINWMEKQNMHNPYGGQAILDINNQVDDKGKMENVLYEMPKTHTSYIDSSWRQELHKYWAGITYTGSDAEYKGTNLFQYIEYHLGYRFVIRDSKLYKEVEKGSNLVNNFTIENVGFGNLLSKMKTVIYITDMNNNVVLTKEVAIDPQKYITKTKVTDTINVTIPENFTNGNYKLYIQYKIGDRQVNGATKPYGAVRLANNNVWNATLEANYLGTFAVIDKTVQQATPTPTPAPTPSTPVTPSTPSVEEPTTPEEPSTEEPTPTEEPSVENPKTEPTEPSTEEVEKSKEEKEKKNDKAWIRSLSEWCNKYRKPVLIVLSIVIVMLLGYDTHNFSLKEE